MTTATLATSLGSIKSLVSQDLKACDNLILEQLNSEVALIGELGKHLINSGGKRIRPLIALLAARAVGHQDQQHILLAAIIEFIHTATLLHDDVVDKSTLRRGKLTANSVWGNQAPVLVGDFLYSRAFQLMVKLNNLAVMDVLSYTTNQLAEGEVLQLTQCHQSQTTELDYYKVIDRKTAKLFEASAKLGATMQQSSREIVHALSQFGQHFGYAYQLIDDALDYSGDTKEIGKNIGDDLSEGKATLPLIYAMANSDAKDQRRIQTAIEQGSNKHLKKIQKIINKSGAIAYTRNQAIYHAGKAIESLATLPDSEYKQALIDLTELIKNRNA